MICFFFLVSPFPFYFYPCFAASKAWRYGMCFFFLVSTRAVLFPPFPSLAVWTAEQKGPKVTDRLSSRSSHGLKPGVARDRNIPCFGSTSFTGDRFFHCLHTRGHNPHSVLSCFFVHIEHILIDLPSRGLPRSSLSISCYRRCFPFFPPCSIFFFILLCSDLLLMCDAIQYAVL